LRYAKSESSVAARGSFATRAPFTGHPHIATRCAPASGRLAAIWPARAGHVSSEGPCLVVTLGSPNSKPLWWWTVEQTGCRATTISSRRRGAPNPTASHPASVTQGSCKYLELGSQSEQLFWIGHVTRGCQQLRRGWPPPPRCSLLSEQQGQGLARTGSQAPCRPTGAVLVGRCRHKCAELL
jgi:hypothetical protein